MNNQNQTPEQEQAPPLPAGEDTSENQSVTSQIPYPEAFQPGMMPASSPTSTEPENVNAFVPQQTVIPPSFQSYNSQNVTKRKLPAVLIISVAVAVVSIAAASLYFLILRNSDTPQNNEISTNASQPKKSPEQVAAETLKTDIANMASIIKGSVSPDSVSAANDEIDAMSNHLADAQKQYAVIQKSNILQDQAVNQKFQAFAAKWGPYETYISNSIADYKAVLPALSSLFDAASSLNGSQPSGIEDLNSRLNDYKSVTNTTLQQMNNMKLILPENQKVIDTAKSYLKNITAGITAIQKYISQGNLSALESELLKLESDTKAFEETLGAILDESDAHEQQLNPTTELAAFQATLNK